jgi:thioredoxin-related protein
MIRQILIVLLLAPLFLQAQLKTGIRFEYPTSWQEVLKKAKEEDKFVFVDCYATWCGPCKWMDREVYMEENVGRYINERFLSIKIQMDSSKDDDDYVRSWYDEAVLIGRTYAVRAFPTYLFFSPEGELVHRFQGALADSIFLNVAADALHPDRQYYTLKAKYKQKTANPEQLRHLAVTARSNGEDGLAKDVVRYYSERYLNKEAGAYLLIKENLEFIISFSQVLTSKDKYFTLFYQNADKVDKIVGRKGASDAVVEEVITREEITDKFRKKGSEVSEQQWKKLKDAIINKYITLDAERIVLNAQLQFYDRKKDWSNLIKSYILKADKYGLDTTGLGKAMINNFVYEVIFMRTDNPSYLDKGIEWMEMLLQNESNDPAAMDTYANLLYKRGRKLAAVAVEEKAMKREQEQATKDNREADSIYKQTLQKMQKSEPTWQVE